MITLSVVAHYFLVPLQGVPSSSQQAHPASQSAAMAVSVAPEKDKFPVGQKPRVFLAIKNLTELKFEVSTENPMRVCVKGKDGDPPETEYHRHLHGDYRAGDGPYLLP